MPLIVPESALQAADAFGDGDGVTVLGGGTIVMPEITYGRLRPDRVLMLAHAGLDEMSGNGTLMIGATVPVQALVDRAPEPLASAARGVADLEVRSQGTIAGNLCAPPGAEGPRGDLQAPLIALGARVRSVGTGGERHEGVEDFLAAGPRGRLVLAIEVDAPRRGAFVSLGRPHANAYTTLSVSCAETADGIRVAAGGVAPRGVRLPSVEAALGAGAGPAEAAARAGDDVRPADDALASAWYRDRVLPVLVTRALTNLQGA